MGLKRGKRPKHRPDCRCVTCRKTGPYISKEDYRKRGYHQWKQDRLIRDQIRSDYMSGRF